MPINTPMEDPGIPTVIDRPNRLPTFVRMIVIVIALAVCGTLAIVVYATLHTREWRAKGIKAQREITAATFERINGRFRQADLVVVSQLVRGDKKVQETTYACQLFALDADGFTRKPLPPQIFTLPGDAPIIETNVLKFAPTFQFDQDSANFSGIVAGRKIYLFDRAISEDPKSPGVLLASRAEVPMITQSAPQGGPNPYEKELWHKIWDLAKDPALAHQRGFEQMKFQSRPLAVRPGIVYRIWIEGEQPPTIHEQEDAAEVSALIQAATNLQKSAKPADE
jgi:hypothetical protein